MSIGFFLELPASSPSSKDLGNGSDLSSLGEGGSVNLGEGAGEPVDSTGEYVRSLLSSEEHRDTGESVRVESSFCLLTAES